MFYKNPNRALIIKGHNNNMPLMTLNHGGHVNDSREYGLSDGTTLAFYVNQGNLQYLLGIWSNRAM